MKLRSIPLIAVKANSCFMLSHFKERNLSVKGYENIFLNFLSCFTSEQRNVSSSMKLLLTFCIAFSVWALLSC